MRPPRRRGPRPALGWGGSTALHEQRLVAVTERLLGDGIETVLDLGCGSGALLEQLLLQPALRRIIGVDSSLEALAAAEARLTSSHAGRDERLALRHGSIMDLDEDVRNVDAVALVETLEHLPPSQISRLERAIFVVVRPLRAVVTTPNREYNTLLGLGPGEYRHPDHRFEWDRARFQSWALGVATRNGYRVDVHGAGPADPVLGSPTQLALFRRLIP